MPGKNAGERRELPDLDADDESPEADEIYESGGDARGAPADEDEFSPETLLPDEGLNPMLRASAGATDSNLREVDVSEIGAGHGLDEAEMAEIDPVGAAAGDAQLRQAVRHASHRNYFSPAETEMWRETVAADIRHSAAMSAIEQPAELEDAHEALGDGESITLSLPEHRTRTLSLQTDQREAEQAYDHHIGSYVQFLATELQRKGFHLEKDHRALGRAFRYPRQRHADAHAALAELPDLWNWIP